LVVPDHLSATHNLLTQDALEVVLPIQEAQFRIGFPVAEVYHQVWIVTFPLLGNGVRENPLGALFLELY
jgi:hypothetical protein